MNHHNDSSDRVGEECTDSKNAAEAQIGNQLQTSFMSSTQIFISLPVLSSPLHGNVSCLSITGNLVGPGQTQECGFLIESLE